jgi:predicted amidophosphoribosyltransferase
VLLVDDVLTSGSTAAECSRELKSAGAADVTVITVATALGWQG